MRKKRETNPKEKSTRDLDFYKEKISGLFKFF
jgi:hypothetical protein